MRHQLYGVGGGGLGEGHYSVCVCVFLRWNWKEFWFNEVDKLDVEERVVGGDWWGLVWFGEEYECM